MVLIVFLVIGAGLLIWFLRTRDRPGRDIEDLRRRRRSPLADLVGIPVERVRDVRLAAVILMLQLARTGSPVTAAEKARILAFMKAPLGLEPAEALYDVAWAYTQPRRPFTLLAEELLPLLRERLTHVERLDLVDMLFAVAGAHSATGELQRRAILQLKRRLLAASPAPGASRTDDSAR